MDTHDFETAPNSCADADAGGDADACVRVDVDADISPLLVLSAGPFDFVVNDNFLDVLWEHLTRRNSERVAEAAQVLLDSHELGQALEATTRLAVENFEAEKARAFPTLG